MDLLSFHYAAYALVTAALFQVCPGRLRPFLLSFASLLLYGSLSAASAAILLVASVGVFFGARALDGDRSRGPLDGGPLSPRFLSPLLSYLLLIKILQMHYAPDLSSFDQPSPPRPWEFPTTLSSSWDI